MANFIQIDGGIVQAANHAECAICFEPLAREPVAALFSPNGKRSCSHYFHSSCIERLQNRSCPMCRGSYERFLTVPSPITDPRGWFMAIDTDGNGVLTYEEVSEGLKTVLPIDWRKIESDTDKYWMRWDRDGNGVITLEEFQEKANGMIEYLNEHFRPPTNRVCPDIRTHPNDWFQYWDEDHSGSLDKGEVRRALIKTLRLFHVSVESVTEILEAIWPIFDHDMSGTISMTEFSARDGLADTIISTLNFG
jgi:Ca2+-binding EF-hand superfamily protein